MQPLRSYLLFTIFEQNTSLTSIMLVSLANRRRIWHACQQLADVYLPQWNERRELLKSMDDTILAHTFCVHMPVVSYPLPVARGCAQRTLWTRRIEDLHMGKKMIETFWDIAGSLVGLSVTIEGHERNVFGRDNSDTKISVESAQLDEENWITGVILHIPEMALLEDYANTDPKGVTVSRLRPGIVSLPTKLTTHR